MERDHDKPSPSETALLCDGIDLLRALPAHIRAEMVALMRDRLDRPVQQERNAPTPS